MGGFLCSFLSVVTVATHSFHICILYWKGYFIIFFCLFFFDPFSLATIHLGIGQAERFQSISQKEPTVQNWMSE